MHIYIVEDDTIIAQQLKKELNKWQYQVSLTQDFSQVDQEVAAIQPDLILMDIGLPAYNGYHWCQQIRQTSNVPILFISSRSDNMDQVMAIQMGADDYITKPIDITLALAKIQALLRRAYDYSSVQPSLSYQGIALDYAGACLTYHDQEMELTHTQLMIMEALIQAQGGFTNRETIMDKCWQEANFIDDNTLSVNISRLRKRLSQEAFPLEIITKKHIGYALKVIDHA